MLQPGVEPSQIASRHHQFYRASEATRLHLTSEVLHIGLAAKHWYSSYMGMTPPPPSPLTKQTITQQRYKMGNFAVPVGKGYKPWIIDIFAS